MQISHQNASFSLKRISDREKVNCSMDQEKLTILYRDNSGKVDFKMKEKGNQDFLRFD